MTRNLISLVVYTFVVFIFTILFCVLWILTKRKSPLPPPYPATTGSGATSLPGESPNVHVLIGPVPVVNVGYNRQMTSSSGPSEDGKGNRSETPPPPYASLFATD